MATYRYARDSKTSAQKAARVRQQRVDECNRMLEMYDGVIASGRKLSAYDLAVQKRNRNTLAKLMSENPNEPA